MKKVLSAAVFVGLLSLPIIGLAAEPIEPPGPEEVPSTPGEIIDLVGRIGVWIFTALLVVAGIFLVVAGFYFVTAGGNPEQVTKARQMLINALIGIAIALASRGLIEVIKTLLKTTT